MSADSLKDLPNVSYRQPSQAHIPGFQLKYQPTLWHEELKNARAAEMRKRWTTRTPGCPLAGT